MKEEICIYFSALTKIPAQWAPNTFYAILNPNGESVTCYITSKTGEPKLVTSDASLVFENLNFNDEKHVIAKIGANEIEETVTSFEKFELEGTDLKVEFNKEDGTTQVITVDLSSLVGSTGGVQSVTGDGVGGTSEDVVMTFPTPAEIGAIEDAPSDGKQYARKDANWSEVVIPSSGVQSVTGDGVGGTSEDVVMTFPTPAEIGSEEDLGNPTQDGQVLASTTAGVRSWVDLPQPTLSVNFRREEYTWNSGAQEFILPSEGLFLFGIYVNGRFLYNSQFTFNSLERKITILDTLDINDAVAIIYQEG